MRVIFGIFEVDKRVVFDADASYTSIRFKSSMDHISVFLMLATISKAIRYGIIFFEVRLATEYLLLHSFVNILIYAKENITFRKRKHFNLGIELQPRKNVLKLFNFSRC